jgi:hypothetical protein
MRDSCQFVYVLNKINILICRVLLLVAIVSSHRPEEIGGISSADAAHSRKYSGDHVHCRVIRMLSKQLKIIPILINAVKVKTKVKTKGQNKRRNEPKQRRQTRIRPPTPPRVW